MSVDRVIFLTCGLLIVACGNDTQATGGGGSGGGSAGGAGGELGGSAPGSVRECETDEDCQIQNDCCACASVPLGAVGACDRRCEQSSCMALGIDPQAACVVGQCVFATSCNATEVACDGAPPDCSDGTVASVDGLCWGPCIPAAECRDVTTCADCGGLACLEEVAFTVTHHCIANADACPSGPTCECLSQLCSQNDLCTEGPDADASCECVSC